MNPIVRFANFAQDLLDRTRAVDFLAPLALRLYLVPIFWTAGAKKLGIDPTFGPNLGEWFASLKNISVEDTAAWFGNPDWGLGLPYPDFLAWSASLTELFGAILLLIGLGVRWISMPLMATMV
ncbi:MAG: DoxX family protein, partial [Pseudomonadota bacterium]|nr:DoxX family protein [Pseudomonadota bacterium]